MCTFYDPNCPNNDQTPNIITVANHYCNVVDSDVEQYFINNLSRNTSVCQSQNDIASYGSYTSLSYPGGATSSGGHNSSTKKSPANSVCSIHHQHHRRSSIVSRSSRSKCPHHRRRKHSTSCSTLHGSIKTGHSSYHGSSSSIFEPSQLPLPTLPLQSESGCCGAGNVNGIGINGDESSVSIVLTPSKITIEHQNDRTPSEDQNSTLEYPNCCAMDLPEYAACSPSPIKWNFMSNGDGEPNKNEARAISSSDTSSDSQKPLRYRQQPHHPSGNNAVSIWQTDGNADEANAIIFHHESEIVENCCDNYYNHCDYSHEDDQEYSASEAELNDFFAKGCGSGQNNNNPSEEPPKLNNMLDIRSQPSTSIDILNRNNISSVINQLNLSPEFRQYEKTTNLSQNSNNLTPNRFPNASAMAVYNSNFWLNQTMDGGAAGLTNDKFINTSRNSLATGAAVATGSTYHLIDHSIATVNNQTPNYLLSDQGNFEVFNISTNRFEKPQGINLTTQNLFDTSAYSNRRYHQELQPMFMTGSSNGGGSSVVLSGPNGNGATRPAPPPPPMPPPMTIPSSMMALSSSTAVANRLHNVTNTMGLSGLYKIVRKRAKKCADYINGDR